jgi:hypothetical protein
LIFDYDYDKLKDGVENILKRKYEATHAFLESVRSYAETQELIESTRKSMDALKTSMDQDGARLTRENDRKKKRGPISVGTYNQKNGKWEGGFDCTKPVHSGTGPGTYNQETGQWEGGV